MADAKSAKKRQLKPARKPETLRQKAEKASIEKKPRRIKRAGSMAVKPVKAVGRGVAKVSRPFGFLLWPFKTRPVRFIGRVLRAVLLLNYIRNSWKELRQVQWPDQRTTLKLTLAVFMFAIFFMVIISGVDYGLDKLFTKLVLK